MDSSYLKLSTVDFSIELDFYLWICGIFIDSFNFVILDIPPHFFLFRSVSFYLCFSMVFDLWFGAVPMCVCVFFALLMDRFFIIVLIWSGWKVERELDFKIAFFATHSSLSLSVVCFKLQIHAYEIARMHERDVMLVTYCALHIPKNAIII